MAAVDLYMSGMQDMTLSRAVKMTSDPETEKLMRRLEAPCHRLNK